MSPIPSQAPAVPLREVLRTFWPYAAPRAPWMLLALLLAAVSPALTGAEIWLFKIVVDDVLVAGDFSLFPAIAAAYVVLTVVQGLLGGADRMLGTWLSQHFLVDLRRDLLRHLGRLPLDFFSRATVGDLLARVSGDVAAIEAFLVSGSTRVLTHALELVVFTVALFWIQPTLALVSLAVAPLFWLTSRWFSTRMRDVSRERQRRSGSISTSLERTIGTMPLVQAYDRVEDEVARYGVEADAKLRAEMSSSRLRSWYVPTVDLIELVGALLVIGLGAWMLSQGQLTVGELLAFLTFLSRLYGPVRGLGSSLTAAYSAAAGAERVIELLRQDPLPADRPDAVELEHVVGELSLEDVGYTYPGATRPALEGVTLRVRPGELVALVGASGAGKSTLARLLMRSIDPAVGRITLDGTDLRDLTRASLRAQTAVVLQETLLHDGTVRDNIAYGRPDAQELDVVLAACLADAHEFVSALPDGYETQVGDRGRRLSGGQAQRIAIARALLRDSPVLLLDEPTSGLDAGSTDRVATPLRRLVRGRTTVMISHDLSLTRLATRIVVLDEGRVVESGTHDDLVRADGHYARLWSLSHPAEVQQPTVVPA